MTTTFTESVLAFLVVSFGMLSVFVWAYSRLDWSDNSIGAYVIPMENYLPVVILAVCFLAGIILGVAVGGGEPMQCSQRWCYNRRPRLPKVVS
jgi:hypothetical protein